MRETEREDGGQQREKEEIEKRWRERGGGGRDGE